MSKTQLDRADAVELRLFIEELACNVCRFMHVATDQVEPQAVRIRQEVKLGAPDAFADIVVNAPRQNYIVEILYGRSLEQVSASLFRKYQREIPWFKDISKIIMIFDSDNHPDRSTLERDVRALVPGHWELELWDEQELLARIREHFGISVESLQPEVLQDVRLAIDRAKGKYAFGDAYEQSPLDEMLLWHFGYWRLRQAYSSANGDKRAILPPATYRSVAVVFADLCGFSGYVRDTPHEHTIRDCLTTFSSRSRYQVINNGGMVYQFLGDAIIGFFGIPDHVPRYVDDAFDCARCLLMLGESVSNEWQRQLDRIQPVRGSHIGVALGDLQILSLRPFSRTHIGAIGDVINMAARLSTFAEPGQVVVSNLVYRKLSDDAQSSLIETGPVEAKNVGRIKAWVYNGATD